MERLGGEEVGRWGGGEVIASPLPSNKLAEEKLFFLVDKRENSAKKWLQRRLSSSEFFVAVHQREYKSHYIAIKKRQIYVTHQKMED